MIDTTNIYTTSSDTYTFVNGGGTYGTYEGVPLYTIPEIDGLSIKDYIDKRLEEMKDEVILYIESIKKDNFENFLEG